MLPARVSSWEVGSRHSEVSKAPFRLIQQEANLPSQDDQFPELAMFSSASGLLLSLLPEILFRSWANLAHSTSCFRSQLSWPFSSSAYIYGASTLRFLRSSA